jgi:hypothetical protein
MGRKRYRLRKCVCEDCYNKSPNSDVARLHVVINRLLSVLDERARRLFAGFVSQAYLVGMPKRISEATEKHPYVKSDYQSYTVDITSMSAHTIRRGYEELQKDMPDAERIGIRRRRKRGDGSGPPGQP